MEVEVIEFSKIRPDDDDDADDDDDEVMPNVLKCQLNIRDKL